VRRTRPIRRIAPLVLALSLLCAACGFSSSESAPRSAAARADSGSTAATAPDTAATDGQVDAGSTDTTDTSTTADVPAPKLDWRSCDGGDVECATVKLPLDYSKPDGKTITVGVARKKATDQSKKVGSLFVNPGGPGASAIDFMEGFDFGDLADRFDLVAVDPRGVGKSSQIDCDSAPGELYAPDPTIEDQADKDTYLAVSQAYVDKCKERNGDLLDHVGTRDTARDMDQIRKGLGEDKLNYLGFSYGTALGQAYADLFPTHIRAMVLDGVVDLSTDGLTGATEQADGFQLALEHFLANCKEKGSACPMGPDPAATLDSVIKKAEASPIPSKTADRPAGPAEVAIGLSDAMYSERTWPDLARALADADKGDGSGMVQLTDDYLQVSSGTEKSTSFDGYFAIGCVDQNFPRSAETVFADAKKANATAPDFGESLVNDYVRCALWPAKADPLTPPKAIGSPPILVVGTTGDPATPYESSVKLAERLPKGRLITYDGEGHTAYGTSSCVTEAADAYLIDLKLPAEGKVCND
jgi:pimeloyl-ACP methyl ester carboxylesterase